jgi:hypothetical protein
MLCTWPNAQALPETWREYGSRSSLTSVTRELDAQDEAVGLRIATQVTPELVDDEVATACGLSSHSSFVNLQLFKTAQYDVMPPARRRTAREADAWPSAQQCGDCDFTFEPRQRQADACMHAGPRRTR